MRPRQYATHKVRSRISPSAPSRESPTPPHRPHSLESGTQSAHRSDQARSPSRPVRPPSQDTAALAALSRHRDSASLRPHLTSNVDAQRPEREQPERPVPCGTSLDGPRRPCLADDLIDKLTLPLRIRVPIL